MYSITAMSEIVQNREKSGTDTDNSSSALNQESLSSTSYLRIFANLAVAGFDCTLGRWSMSRASSVAESKLNEVRREVEAGQIDRALLKATKLLEFVQAKFPETSMQVVGTYLVIGNIYLHMSQFAQAQGYYKMAVQLGEKTAPLKTLATCLIKLSDCEFMLENIAGASNSLSRAIDFLIKDVSNSATLKEMLLKAYIDQVSFLRHLDKDGAALVMCNRAIDLAKELRGEDSAQLAVCCGLAGAVCNKQVLFEQAKPYLDKARDILRPLAQRLSGEYSEILRELGWWYIAYGDYERGETLMREACIVGQSPKTHVTIIAKNWIHLGRMLYMVEKFEESEQCFAQAVAYLENAGAAYSFHLKDCLQLIAGLDRLPRQSVWQREFS